MSTFDSIQDCTARCAIMEAAETAQTDPDFLAAAEAAKQASLVQHYTYRIMDWCNETNTSSSQARSSELSLPIEGVITSTTLDAWETELEAKGYTIVRADGMFKIILTMWKRLIVIRLKRWKFI